MISGVIDSVTSISVRKNLNADEPRKIDNLLSDPSQLHKILEALSPQKKPVGSAPTTSQQQGLYAAYSHPPTSYATSRAMFLASHQPSTYTVPSGYPTAPELGLFPHPGYMPPPPLDMYGLPHNPADGLLSPYSAGLPNPADPLGLYAAAAHDPYNMFSGLVQPPRHHFPSPTGLPVSLASSMALGSVPRHPMQYATPERAIHTSSLEGSTPHTETPKRKSWTLFPDPEPSPEGGYIGQHSQGIGGHYESSYVPKKKFRRLN